MRERLIKFIKNSLIKHIDKSCLLAENIADDLLADGIIVPPCKAVDAIDIETIKSWLYEIAINNVGCAIDGDFSVACEEIISRLDGLRSFARDRIVEKALKEGESDERN